MIGVYSFVIDLFLTMRCDEFNGIQAESPLSPSQGATMHATDFRLIKLSFPQGRTYTASGNLSWISPFWALASVPVLNSAVRMLQLGKFKEPQPLEITVMVSTASDPNNNTHRMTSALRRLSPEEEHIAYVLATFADVSQGRNVQDRGENIFKAVIDTKGFNFHRNNRQKWSMSFWCSGISIATLNL